MPTPSSRTPVRIARGTYTNLNASLTDLQEGEVVYATDEDKLYVKEGGALVDTQAPALTGAQIKTAYEGEADTNAFTDDEKTKLSELTVVIEDTIQSTSTTTNGGTTTVSSGLTDLTFSYDGSNASFGQTGADDAGVESFMQNTLANASAGDVFRIDYIDGEGGNQTGRFTIATVTVNDATTMSGVSFTYSAQLEGQASGDYSNIFTSSISLVAPTTYDVSVTGSNNPVFDDTEAVFIDSVEYAGGTWTVSGTTATATLNADPALTNGDEILQGRPSLGTYLQDSDLGVTVQPYDADTAKLDTAQTFTNTIGIAVCNPDNLNIQKGATENHETVTLAGSTATCDLLESTYFSFSISSNSTVAFSNIAGSTRVNSWVVRITVSGTGTTITWPGAVIWNGGSAPSLTDNKTHLFVFSTDDGGTTIRGAGLVDYTG